MWLQKNTLLEDGSKKWKVLPKDQEFQLKLGEESIWFLNYLKLHAVLVDGGDLQPNLDNLFNSELWIGKSMLQFLNSHWLLSITQLSKDQCLSLTLPGLVSWAAWPATLLRELVSQKDSEEVLLILWLDLVNHGPMLSAMFFNSQKLSMMPSTISSTLTELAPCIWVLDQVSTTLTESLNTLRLSSMSTMIRTGKMTQLTLEDKVWSGKPTTMIKLASDPISNQITAKSPQIWSTTKSPQEVRPVIHR